MAFTVQTDTTALEFILALNKGMSKQKAKDLLKNSHFTCDGVAAKLLPSTPLAQGQSIEIFKGRAVTVANVHPSRSGPVVIKHEDESLLIAVKPAGVLSCNDRTQPGVAFTKVLQDYLTTRERRKIYVWIVHRLDREVEGLLLFAKTEEIQQRLKDDWKQTKKQYLALVEGKPNPPSGTIESWLRDTPSHKVEVHKVEVEGSVFAKTEYKTLKSIGAYRLLEITLHTGKKNQIRAHLESIGCPIVGDRKYGADDSVVRQVRLVASSLEFVHPVSGKVIAVRYEPKASFYAPSKRQDERYK